MFIDIDYFIIIFEGKIRSTYTKFLAIYEEILSKSDIVSLLTIILYVFIVGIEFLVEDFSELFKRHVPIGNHRVVYDNWIVGNTVSGKRFLHYRMILLFCLLDFFYFF